MTYRVYFHKRDGNCPVVWSIDEGAQDTEIHVQWISFSGVVAASFRNLNAKPGEPSGWFELSDVVLTVANGGALFTGVPNG